LSGWTLRTTGKKVFSLGDRSIAPHGYLVLSYATTKLTLKNSGDTLSLYNAAGHLADQSSYLGTAPSGRSFSRIGSPPVVAASNPADAPQGFAWAVPTPGKENQVDVSTNLNTVIYPYGAPINAWAIVRGVSGVVALCSSAIVLSAILAALVVYSLKSDESISQLFFS
jgi:hypothetical protein